LIRDRANAKEVDSVLQQVAAALKPLTTDLTAALGATLSEPRRSPTPTSADPVQSREAAAKLALMLSESDPGAADFVEANQAALRPFFGGGTWPEFEKLVQGYAFGDAQAQLEQALRESSA
jgi:hypothetical protein